MKLLTAAVDIDPDGFSWTVPGELVVAYAWCDPNLGDNHDPEHECLYVFVGLASGKATTLARVSEVDMTRAQLLEAVRDSWAGDTVTDEAIDDEAEELLRDAAPWPVGTFLRRYKDELCPA